MATTPEGKTKLLIKKFLDKNNIPNWSIIPSAFGTSTGMSDRVAITKDGRWLAIEAKAEGKRDKVTVNQQDFIDTVNTNGGRAFVVSCQSDLEQLAIVLRHHELI